MVTKLKKFGLLTRKGSVLAKIHMVTKPVEDQAERSTSSVLAKIHMVTKPFVKT